MTRLIRVLHLEDSPQDAELIHHQLEVTGLRPDIVLADRKDTFEDALARESFDLILTDFNLPDYDGTSAIRRARERQPDTPVIVISGTMGEEEAVRCLHEGATDYVLKQRLARLEPAVTRAMNEAAERRMRKGAEQALRQSLERLRLAQQAGQIGVFDYDYLSGTNYWSPELEALYGLSAGQFSGTSAAWIERVHPEDRAEVERQTQLAGESGEYSGEFRITWPDGSVRWIYARGLVSRDQRGQPTRMLGVNVDVTDRKQMEAQFRQAQKMESVGQLAGGIAHDFNNLLTVINGMADLAIEQVKEGDPLNRDLQEIRRAGERAATLTRQLLAFSRKQILQPQVLALNTVVGEMEGMLRRLLGEDVDLVVVPTPGPARVRADAGQIEQVLANLAVNARDAMPQGGRMTIEARHVEIDERHGRQHGVAVQPGPYVMLAISDTGMGMDEGTRKRIFEPFFTTKAGKGTGLGLSTVYGIVKQSGGFIWVYSEVGQGTRFEIYLPQVVEAATPTRSRPTVASARGTETVLVVEDMAGLRHLATRMLASAGYTVLSAANGEEALRLLEHDAQPVHLLLTDVVMPGMSGRALAERFQALRPAARVLYISGYTDDVVVRHGVLDARMPFLAKPFTAMELTRKVREVLDAQA